MISDRSAVKIHIIGDVQGVFFRHHTAKEAKRLSILGWVKNEYDGSVTIFAQGSSDSLEKIIAWASEGSPMARVEKVEVSESDSDDKLNEFSIL